MWRGGRGARGVASSADARVRVGGQNFNRGLSWILIAAVVVLAELGFEGFEAAFEVVEFGAEVSEILFQLGDAGGLSAGCGSEVGCIGG